MHVASVPVEVKVYQFELIRRIFIVIVIEG